MKNGSVAGTVADYPMVTWVQCSGKYEVEYNHTNVPPQMDGNMRLSSTLVLLATMLQASLSMADQPIIEMQTSEGLIVLELEPELAPKTVSNFLTYVGDGYYNGTIFHRVIDGFMIQGGGFTDDYTRKSTRKAITNEANNGLRNLRYTIAMARTNSPHSATAQFFINDEDNRNLDYKSSTARGWGYTVFGRVIEGQEVVDKISEAPTGPGGPFSRDAPSDKIIIESVALQTTEPSELVTPSGEPVLIVPASDKTDIDAPAAQILEQSGALAVQ